MAQRKNSFSEENFMTGFSVGLAAGAAGMYLFGTDEGEELREELKAHWKEAVSDLLAEGTIETAEQDMWQLFKDILNKAAGEVEENNPELTAKQKINQQNRSNKKKNLFKGV
ncbi:MAG: YtxH domain-containing protein [Candidatus Pacebacteria bacterium]|nr:YtxH domain-containing protein [Candidatus Paceibacterota bacterium]